MIAIIDYQMGNLRSVQKALEKVGAEAIITDDHRQLQRADKILLPGVGAFGDAIAQLRRRDLVQPIRDAVADGKPFLGICLGLQLLMDYSEEGGHHEGLGIIPGKCVRFQIPRQYKVPHMGWNQIRVVHRTPVMDGIDDGEHFYFVHSYHVVPNDPQHVALEADYPEPFCAAVVRGNLFATQFHPEKSQQAGLHLLGNFAGQPSAAR